ncbi:hypothetical protein CCAX7_11250 [Capsulimonas corticalis]|uniref:Uncharacterized protein n=1 Tax=Capsulimonas corticalis TaxID=2219043 RepID=A0A402CUT3_9BACT|nr:hypothetical protein [Capsulimonas corticalis]BDI29074.1 hypothetical protein CCAX7_11250 [Capsulimonas corticalis]
MLKYIPIFASAAALWFLINTIYSMSTNNTHTNWQLGEIAGCLIVLIFGVKHAYKTHH